MSSKTPNVSPREFLKDVKAEDQFLNRISKLLPALLLSALLSFQPAANSAEGTSRTLTFPTTFTMGQLYVCYADGSRVQAYKSVPATGPVTVVVPPWAIVSLDLNTTCVQHPKMLADIPTVGIDQISMNFMSLEDGTSQCDKALAALPVFKHPLSLICAHSDATDAGLLAFKSLGMLKHLDCIMSGIDGHFLNDTKRLQNLTLLNISNNGIKAEYLKRLPQLTKLEILDLALTNLTNDDLKQVAQLKQLKRLYISYNPKITDSGLESILPCTSLSVLDLSSDREITDKALPTIHKFSKLTYLKISNTKITAKALLRLKDLKLKTLVLSDNYWKVDVDNLRKVFKPGVIQTGTRGFTKDIEEEFAPVK